MSDKKKTAYDPLARTRLDAGSEPQRPGSSKIKDILTSLGDEPVPDPDPDSSRSDEQERTLLLGSPQASPLPLKGWLVVLDMDGGPVKSFELVRPVTLVGRGADCHVRLDDPTVSRLHCEIVYDGSNLEIRDKGAGNGVVLDGYPRTRAGLANGARITLGRTEMVVRFFDA